MWISGIGRFHIRIPDLPMDYSDLTNMIGYHDNNSSNVRHATCPLMSMIAQWLRSPSIALQVRVWSLRWRHNGHDGVSNHQPHHCLLNRLFGCRSKKTSKRRVTGLCAGNSPGTSEFPAQMASNAEKVSIWWRHHGRRKWRARNLPRIWQTNCCIDMTVAVFIQTQTVNWLTKSTGLPVYTSHRKYHKTRTHKNDDNDHY